MTNASKVEGILAIEDGSLHDIKSRETQNLALYACMGVGVYCQ